jgi:hypothetical protein
VSLIYESTLDGHSAIFARQVCLVSDYFYEPLEFTVSIAGNYSFWSHSTIDTFGHLYHDDFNLFQSAMNQLSSNDDSCGNGQFQIFDSLLPNKKHVLVITSFGVSKTSDFSLISAGSMSIQFIRLSKCAHSVTYTGRCTLTSSIGGLNRV